MGLDMYLKKRKYIGANYEHNHVAGAIYVSQNGVEIPIDFNKITEVEEEGLYWRKANAIHKWFVDNVQDGNDDCKEYYVSEEKLKELLKKCKEVVKKAVVVDGQVQNGATLQNGEWIPNYEQGKVIQNAEEIAKILPTEDGFFFGSTEYGEYYLEDIKYTIKGIEGLLKEAKEFEDKKMSFNLSFIYHSSW